MRCGLRSPTCLDAPPVVRAKALDATFCRQRGRVKQPGHRIGKHAAASPSARSASAGHPGRRRPDHWSPGRRFGHASTVPGCRGSAPTVTPLIAIATPPVRFPGRWSSGSDDPSSLLTSAWPGRSRSPGRCPRAARGPADAARNAHNMTWAGVRSTRAYTHRWVIGSCPSGGARHERVLCEAPGWRSACLQATPWPKAALQALCQTGALHNAALCSIARRAIDPRTHTALRAAKQGADRLAVYSPVTWMLGRAIRRRLEWRSR